MAVQIQIRRGTAAEWTSANPTLAEGELGLETDTSLLKIGDGDTAWSALAYAVVNGGIVDGSVTEIKLANSAVTTNKIANGNVTAAKLSATAAIQPTIIDAKGDLIAGTASDVAGRLAVGANGTYLRANSSTTTGLEWGTVSQPITAVQSATVATSQTTTSTAYTDLATVGPNVTITTGTTALVTICCTLSNSNNGPHSLMSQAISGATTVAASDVNAIRFSGGVWASGFGSFAKTFLVTGLNAGSNTFTAKYRVTSDTGTFFDRTITVFAL